MSDGKGKGKSKRRRNGGGEPSPRWQQRWRRWRGEPENREDLESILDTLESKKTIDSAALDFMRGALRITDLQVREVMLARSQMVVIPADSDWRDDVLPEILKSRHSRYPVIGATMDEVLGVLLTKDLLPVLLKAIAGEPTPDITELLREPIRIPENQPLNVLLQELRQERQHMAIAMDEHGGVAGIVTMEDILEEIVGDIFDEYDDAEDENELIQPLNADAFLLLGETPLSMFNARFDTHLDDPDMGTIGGLLLQHWGHVPKPGKRAVVAGYEFTVRKANRQRIVSLELRPHVEAAAEASQSE